MTVKTRKVKTKSVVKSKAVGKTKPIAKKVVAAKSARKTVSLSKKAEPTTKSSTKTAATKQTQARASRSTSSAKPVEVTRTINVAPQIRKPASRATERRRAVDISVVAATQFAFMKAPRPDYAFEVGDNVEVFCDHEKGRERVRGWIRGIVVQVDNKMVAVQFRSNVFLTDGWMVPDRILWYPLNSEHIRPVPGKKTASKKELIPDY